MIKILVLVIYPSKNGRLIDILLKIGSTNGENNMQARVHNIYYELLMKCALKTSKTCYTLVPIPTLDRNFVMFSKQLEQ